MTFKKKLEEILVDKKSLNQSLCCNRGQFYSIIELIKSDIVEEGKPQYIKKTAIERDLGWCEGREELRSEQNSKLEE